jgi:Nucleoside-diphosphate-sugar epimerases
MSVHTEKARMETLAGPDDLILITGGSGFIGRKVVENLQGRGFRRIRCLTRSRIDSSLNGNSANGRGELEVRHGNLLSREDCARAVQGAAVVYHLAAARGEKSFSEAYMNSVVTTRNLLDALVRGGCVRRFVNVSSFTVYTKRNEVLDESCPMEEKPALRGEAYCFAKCRQEEIVQHYGHNHGVPYVILRPGHVYGPGNEGISSRVGIGTFGIFLHLGGSNRVPLSYVDNCADAIVRAGIAPGIDGEIINVVDDDLPTSREFLRMYKKYVRHFHSIYLPRPISYMLCALWENYSNWSKGQLPPAYNRRIWYAYWKHGRFSNAKLKQLLQWRPLVTTAEGLNRYFQSCREKTLCA